MQQKLIINYDATKEINLDDVFYTVIKTDLHHFTTPCKVCNDKGSLTVNGVTFRCPCCSGGRGIEYTAYQYVVKRLRVYKVEYEKSNLSWTPSQDGRFHVSLYNKTGKGYGYDGKDRFTMCCDTQDLSKINKIYKEYCAYTNMLYDDYQKAIEQANIFNAIEIDRLNQYNSEHGTSYSISFDLSNDPKSK